MKKPLFALASCIILLNACTTNSTDHYAASNQSYIADTTPITQQELNHFYQHMQKRLDKTPQPKPSSSASTKPIKTLKILDGAQQTLVTRAFALCTSKHPCNDKTLKVLAHLNYNITAESIAQPHSYYHAHVYHPHIYYYPHYPHYHHYYHAHEHKTIMLASWDNFCSQIKQAQNISCQLFKQTVYFRDVNGSEYEVYIKSQNS